MFDSFKNENATPMMCQHIWKTFAKPYNNCFWSLQSLFVSSEVVCYVFRCKDFCQFVLLPKQPAPPAGPPLPKAMPRPPVNVPWPVECTVWSEHAHICPGMCSSKKPSLSGNYLKLKHAGHEHTTSTFVFWNFSQSCHLRRWQRLQELQLPLGDHWPLDFASVKIAWSYDCAHFPMLMWIKKSFFDVSWTCHSFAQPHILSSLWILIQNQLQYTWLFYTHLFWYVLFNLLCSLRWVNPLWINLCLSLIIHLHGETQCLSFATAWGCTQHVVWFLCWCQ